MQAISIAAAAPTLMLLLMLGILIHVHLLSSMNSSGKPTPSEPKNTNEVCDAARRWGDARGLNMFIAELFRCVASHFLFLFVSVELA